jgi:FkbM family methyltransferase
VAVAEIDGSVLWAPASDWKRVCYYMLSSGLDPGLARFLRQNLSRGNVFIDAGAGIGAYTLLAASLNGNATIYSFEPDPEAYRWLATNLAGAQFNIGGRVQLQNMALEQSGASLDEIAANARQVALARIGGGSTIPAALRAIERICHNNPAVRILIEYCSVLADRVDFLLLVEDMERQGFVVRRIDGAGETRDLQREELRGAFSMNLLLERAGR